MDWRAIKFDWNCARAFLVTAEEGSLSAAAKVLGLAQSTLGRQVAALEQELGVTLFERAGRGVELTATGIEVLNHVRDMGNAASLFSLSASGRSESIEGNVCITASEITAVYFLPEIIVRLREAVPGIQIELIVTNTESNLKRREADIAIRGFRPTQPDLITRKLRDVEGYLYATPEYLRSIHNPASASAFSEANFIAFDTHENLIQLLNTRGFNLTAKNFPIATENSLAQWELIKAGAGIGIMPKELGDAYPCVQRVPGSEQPLTGELWIAAHRELKTSRRVRVVFDFLVSELS